MLVGLAVSPSNFAFDPLVVWLFMALRLVAEGHRVCSILDAMPAKALLSWVSAAAVVRRPLVSAHRFWLDIVIAVVFSMRRTGVCAPLQRPLRLPFTRTEFVAITIIATAYCRPHRLYPVIILL